MSRDHEPSTDRSADAHVRATISQVRELADVGIRAPMGRLMENLDAIFREQWAREPKRRHEGRASVWSAGDLSPLLEVR